jgi:ABC-2 type transport system permease protein
VVLALGVLAAAVHLLGWQLSLGSILGFVVTLGAGLLVYYSLQLAFAALVLYKPTFLFTWVFHGFFQLARYPVQIYPDWLRIMLSWIIPVALMTTIPAQVLRGEIGWGMVLLAAAISVLVFAGASLLFHFGMRHYSSASS